MHLIKSQNVRDAEASTPASVFTEKYDWLLRWALHFTQNDHAVAEDLVQEAFVRLIVSWPRIKDNIDQVEPFLYSTLKYAHLMEIRRSRRFNFQNLALIEFDNFRLSLREEKTCDPIEVQDDLRRIVAYLCWRKGAVKSASVLLLRFFHGYFPEEIARIALMKRGAIDELLRVSREEVKAYLANSSSIEIMHQGKMPELMPRQMALPQEQFAEELRTTIYQAKTMDCPSREQWLQWYRTESPKPLPVDLLAHLVSCDRCLATISTKFDFPSRSNGIAESGIIGSVRRSKRGSGSEGKASPEQIRRSIAGGMDRYQKLYQHHPRALMIAVNGNVIAMRDVNSATSELKVQTDPEKSLGLIDVLSEQELTLLTLYVPTGPPQTPPEIRHEITLSDNRKLELLLCFTSEGAVIELHYSDPHFITSPLVEADFEDAAGQTVNDDSMQEPAVVEAPQKRRPWWKRIFDWFSTLPMPEMTPMFATAIVCAVAAIMLFAVSLHRSSVMKPSELLARASSEISAPMNSGVKGVVVQTIRIQTSKRKLERTVYRDVEGRRYPRAKALDSEDANLVNTLSAAGVSWADPLSPASFDHWQRHETIQTDVVKRSGSGLLTLTATVNDPVVASESLTVRESDFHAVGKSIHLRSQETIEIAEVSYGVFPWTSINPDLFEPVSLFGSTPDGDAHSALLPRIAAPLTDLQLDEAELSTRLVLRHLQMDDSNQLALLREPDGIHVQGVVLSAEEKHRLQTELYLVPHVVASISTVDEMNAQPARGAEITRLKQSSVAVVEPSSLEKYLAEKGVGHETAGPLAQELVDSSFSANHESKAITELLDRFAQNDRLSLAARTSLSQLLVQHKSALLNALQEEERQLSTLNLTSRVPATASGPVQNNAEALRSAAERNFSLCMELTSGSSASAQPAQTIVPQLAAAIAQLRAVTLRISASSQLYTPPTNHAATNHESR